MPKNTDGHLGPICNNCGGYGFTNLMTGGAANCLFCQGDGIEPINVRELSKKVDSMDGKLNQILEKINE